MRKSITALCCVSVLACLLSVSSVPQEAMAADPASGWGEAVMLEFLNPPLMGDAYDPDVAADASGDAFAVWEQPDGSRNCVFANRYVRDFGWTGAILIDSAGTYDCSNPRVAMDGSGNAIAVWQQYDTGVNNIWANMYVAGEGWGQPEVIEGQSQEAGLPMVLIDGDGNATVLWRQYISGQGHIWSCRYVPGEGWGTEEEAEGYVDWAYTFDADVDDAGCVVAVWSQWDGSHLNLSANRYVPGEGWGVAEMIGGNASGDVAEPKVAVDPAGNALAVWCQWNDGLYSSLYCRYTVGEGWGPATLLEDEDVEEAVYPRIACDPAGNALVVWQQRDAGVDSIWSSRYVPGEGWGPAGTVEGNDLFATHPLVVVDRHGNGTALWYQSDGVRNTICSSRYVPGVGWGGMELASTNGTGGSAGVDAAVDGIGNVFAVWLQNDDYRYNVWANTYLNPDLDAPPVSIESPSDGVTLEVPTVEVSGTTEPGAALDINGAVVSVGGDGSFSCVVALLEGENTITATATDLSGNSATDSVTVTYVNPVYALEEQLADALEEMALLQAQLDDALADYAAVQALLDEAEGEVADLQTQLDAALALLVSMQTQLDAAEADLAEAQAELEAADDDVESLEFQLDGALFNLTVAQEDLAEALEELDAVREELDSTGESLDDSDSLNTLLMVGLVVALVVAAVMAVMYLMLRGRRPGPPA